MKKVISLLLAVMMIFSTLAVGASAAVTKDEEIFNLYQQKIVQSNQVILSFDLNGGTIKGGVKVFDYDQKYFYYDENYSEAMYYMIPDNINNTSNILDQQPGSRVNLPSVNAPSGYSFNGWYCYADNKTYAANRSFVIPYDVAGTVVQFKADFSLAQPEEDTMAGVMDILVKVFGTIIGLLFYSNEYGSAATEVGMQIMEDLLGGLFS